TNTNTNTNTSANANNTNINTNNANTSSSTNTNINASTNATINNTNANTTGSNTTSNTNNNANIVSAPDRSVASIFPLLRRRSSILASTAPSLLRHAYFQNANGTAGGGGGGGGNPGANIIGTASGIQPNTSNRSSGNASHLMGSPSMSGLAMSPALQFIQMEQEKNQLLEQMIGLQKTIRELGDMLKKGAKKVKLWKRKSKSGKKKNKTWSKKSKTWCYVLLC
ncbi:hypothetical protein RFI_11505, partial [Reticulomyxa filosa]